MSIKIRVILFLFLLSLYPWASVQYLRQSEENTRSLEADYLSDRVSDIAQLISLNPSNLGRQAQVNPDQLTEEGFFFYPLLAKPQIDGFSEEEWSAIPVIQLGDNDPGFSISYQAGIEDQRLYLLIKVKDATPVSQSYYRSLLANGDYLGIKLSSARTYYLRLGSLGKIDIYYLGANDTLRRSTDISAHWQINEEGYQVELTTALRLANNRFGFFVVDAQKDTNLPLKTIGNIATTERLNGIYPIVDGAKAPYFTHHEQKLTNTLSQLSSVGLRLHVVDSRCNILATAGRTSATEELDASWLTKTLYNAVLFNGSTENYDPNQSFACKQHLNSKIITNKASLWSMESENDLVAYAALSLDKGPYAKSILVAEQSRDRYVMFNNQSFGSYLYYTLGISLFIITVIGLYLSIWSWRLRALNRSAQLVVDEGGDVSASFKPSQSADEIGQLSRNYGSLLEQIRSHNDYLKTLAQKLSHEMRTPLAIVSTSLDNLSSDNETKVYLERARDGVHRLSYIMTSMGQAKKIEEAIQHSEFEILDVRELIAEVCNAYGKIYQQHNLSYNPPEHADKIVINGSGELLIQMLDKLVDNAVDFSPSGSTITVALEQDKKQVRIKVINTGPLLADGNNEALFQQLVTYRDNRAEKVHLGLGLFITRLIAEHHGGTVAASNLTDKSGVSFCVSLPR
jgi:two-component system sensor histidine kinase ChvG